MKRDDRLLTKKIVLVTGAAKRLGRATALAAADEGATVAISYRDSVGDARALLFVEGRPAHVDEGDGESPGAGNLGECRCAGDDRPRREGSCWFHASYGEANTDASKRFRGGDCRGGDVLCGGAQVY